MYTYKGALHALGGRPGHQGHANLSREVVYY